MKAFKTEIIDAIVKKAETERIIRLSDIATELGHSRISAQDCRDISLAVCRRLPSFRKINFKTAAQMAYPSTARLFETTGFAELGLGLDFWGDTFTIDELDRFYYLDAISSTFDVMWYGSPRIRNFAEHKEEALAFARLHGLRFDRYGIIAEDVKI